MSKRILWHSNSPWSGTGYGNQTAIFVPRLQKLGYEMAVSAFYGLEGAAIKGEGGVQMLPRNADIYGNDVLEDHAHRFFDKDQLAGLVLTLMDIWVMHADVLRELRCAAWTPVDHEPAQPPSVRVLRDSGTVPIAMSRFGEQALREAGLDPLYVPHAFEGDKFYERDRVAAKKMLTFDTSQFVVGMVAANKGAAPSRKGFAQALGAFARFRRRHSDAVLYLHTEAKGTYQGVNLVELIQHYGLKNAVKFCDQYQYALTFPLDYMAGAYSAMDVLLNPSYGEGFGVPIIEAQACGTPVIVGDNTAQRELCGVGWKVKGHRFWTQLGSFMFAPDEHSIYEALCSAYKHRDDRDRRKAAVEFAADYEADVVTERYWTPVLAEVERRVGL